MLITTEEPYKAAWEQYVKNHDLNALIMAVAAKYATDPEYGSLVSLIARQSNVARAIAAAREDVMLKREIPTPSGRSFGSAAMIISGQLLRSLQRR